MEQKQENIVTMMEVVIAYLDSNQSIWTSLNAFATHVAELKTKRDAIAPYLNKQTQKTIGVTQDKKKLKTIAISQAVIIAGNVEIFAADNNDNTLRENMRFTKSSLNILPDTELAIKLQLIHDTALNLLPQMSNYGNSTTNLSNLQAAVTAYHDAIPKPRNTTAQKKTATSNIVTILKEANTIFKKLDKLALNFTTTHSDFLTEYNSCRQIIDYAHHKTRLELLCIAAAANPIAEANISLVSKDDTFTLKTNPDGIALFSGIKKGIYSLTAEKDGYQTHTQTEVKVQAGKTTHLKFILAALD